MSAHRVGLPGPVWKLEPARYLASEMHVSARGSISVSFVMDGTWISKVQT